MLHAVWLTKEQIRQPQVCINGSRPSSFAASRHGVLRALSFHRLPQGRKATLGYLDALWAYPDPWGGKRSNFSSMVVNPSVPEFPTRTELALVRQINLFDRDGSLVGAPIPYLNALCENVGPNSRHVWTAAAMSQDFYEIKLDRPKFFSGNQEG